MTLFEEPVPPAYLQKADHASPDLGPFPKLHRQLAPGLQYSSCDLYVGIIRIARKADGAVKFNADQEPEAARSFRAEALLPELTRGTGGGYDLVLKTFTLPRHTLARDLTFL